MAAGGKSRTTGFQPRGTIALAIGYVAAGMSDSLWQYKFAHGLLIGFGSSATFAPLLAHTSMWFIRRRGIAVGIFASGNYLAGTVWPPVVQHFIAAAGWRQTYVGIAIFCVATMLPLVLLLKPLFEARYLGFSCFGALTFRFGTLTLGFGFRLNQGSRFGKEARPR